MCVFKEVLFLLFLLLLLQLLLLLLLLFFNFYSEVFFAKTFNNILHCSSLHKFVYVGIIIKK